MKTTNKNDKDYKPKDPKQTPETTGHSWDGIEEYNTPAPRWWLIVWIICIIWSIIYWFFYPTWPIPGGNSKGLKNWSKESELKTDQEKFSKTQDVYLEKLSKSSFEEIAKDPALTEYALKAGRAAFKDNCIACHGSDAQGSKGFPNLDDDDWLYGGTVEEIYNTITYGIRSGHSKKNTMMPAFGADKILTKEEVSDVADYVLSLSNNATQNSKGQAIFKAQCAVCHGANAKGNKEMGAPNLTDAIWLYGKSKDDVIYTITHARNSIMPNWNDRLDENTIKSLAIYVHSLGGGE
jgi:cytochrome c oxidase cbb3-type subunit 3